MGKLPFINNNQDDQIHLNQLKETIKDLKVLTYTEYYDGVTLDSGICSKLIPTDFVVTSDPTFLDDTFDEFCKILPTLDNLEELNFYSRFPSECYFGNFVKPKNLKKLFLPNLDGISNEFMKDLELTTDQCQICGPEAIGHVKVTPTNRFCDECKELSDKEREELFICLYG